MAGSEKIGMGSRNSSQAMLSLFSAYDDDAEDEQNKSLEEPVSQDTVKDIEESIDDQFSGSEDEQEQNSKRNTPEKPKVEEDSPTQKKLKLEKREDGRQQFDALMAMDFAGANKMTKLVSYGDAVEDDDENEDDEEEFEAGDLFSVKVEASAGVNFATSMGDEQTIVQGGEDGESLLPPEPPGKCSRHLQDKVTRMYDKMVSQRMNLNHSIQRKKEFRNPSIYEKLIQFCGIDEKGTNYPPELFDPSIWGPESYYTELAKVQKEEMDKREKERKDKTKIEFVSGIKKDSARSSGERKSKWDTQAIKGVEVVSQTVTTSTSGNKTTVISAVGTLKKSKS